MTRFLALLLVLAASATILGACSEEDPDLAAVTTEGTVDLDKIKLGVSEQVFQEAVVTFVRNMAATANAGGMHQYLSKGDISAAAGKNPGSGAQYVVEVRDGACFAVFINYNEHAVSREAAEADLKRLLPADAPPQSRVSDEETRSVYYFGDEYVGEMTFTRGNKNLVRSLKVVNTGIMVKNQKARLEAEEAAAPLIKEQSKPGDKTK
jgi:hypothetical protein